jgi:hypothetical protein
MTEIISRGWYMRCCDVRCTVHLFFNVLATICCWNWNSCISRLILRYLICHDNLTMRLNLVLPLIRWSIIFAFGSRGPASRTCIIERWLSSPSTCYAQKFRNVHECELTSINHRRVSCSDDLFFSVFATTWRWFVIEIGTRILDVWTYDLQLVTTIQQ